MCACISECILECMCGCMHVWICVTEFLSEVIFWNLIIICSVLWLLFKLFFSTEDTPAGKLPREKRDQPGSTDETRELFQPLRMHIHYSLGASLDSDTKEMLRIAVKKSVQKISTVLSGMCADFWCCRLSSFSVFLVQTSSAALLLLWTYPVLLSKYAESDLHLIWISSETLARYGPRLDLHNMVLAIMWRNTTESESGKLVRGQLHFARSRPDDSCILACFQTRCIRPNLD